jgi:hypothetical protein
MRILVDANGNPLVGSDWIPSNKREKDKEVFLFNPVTGELDLALKFNENRIITHLYNEAGTRLQTYDKNTDSHLDSGPLVVIDVNGNVIVI